MYFLTTSSPRLPVSSFGISHVCPSVMSFPSRLGCLVCPILQNRTFRVPKCTSFCPFLQNRTRKAPKRTFGCPFLQNRTSGIKTRVWLSDSAESDNQTRVLIPDVRFWRNGHPNVRFGALRVRFWRNGQKDVHFGTLNVRFCRIGQTRQPRREGNDMTDGHT